MLGSDTDNIQIILKRFCSKLSQNKRLRYLILYGLGFKTYVSQKKLWPNGKPSCQS